MENELKGAKTALMSNGVWICFSVDPTLQDIQTARRLLDQLADELIKERLNVDS